MELILFKKELIKIGGYGDKFFKLKGSYRNFAVFSEQGFVLLGSQESINQHKPKPPTVIPELQKSGCISVASGERHLLALMKDGEVLSWGDTKYGSLGLGRPSHKTAIGRKLLTPYVESPTPVMLQGRPAIAIAANSHHSCAITK